MVRINLLPPEIIERRRYERYYPRIFVVAGVLVGILLVVWVVLGLFVSSKEAQLQQTQQSTQQLQAQAESFSVFEQRREVLEARSKIADLALVDRIDMGGLAEDVTYILPEEVWIASLLANEESGMVLTGYAEARVDENNFNVGYKSVAATLVRLNSLASLNNVWLTKATVEQYQAYQPSSDASLTVVRFDATARITTATAGTR